MTTIEQALFGLGSAVLATLCGTVVRLWTALDAERKARIGDAATYTEKMLDFRDRLREADAAEIKRLRDSADREVEEHEARRDTGGRRKARS